MIGCCFYRCFILILFLLSFIGLSHASIEKPELELREYRHVVLDNGMDVLLVSDDASTVAGAALALLLGGDQDPKDIPGLVHLLEHMLFSGSERYPDRGGFRDYISSAGGVYNAYTAADHTNFFFQVANNRLKEGLSRFSDFITAPALAPDAVADEVAIVQSEFDGRQDQLNWHVQNVLRQLVKPQHPASRMKMGNRASFEGVSNEALVKRLKSLHERHFTADQMKLVVMGSQPLDQLQDWVEEAFATVRTASEGDGNAPNTQAAFLKPEQTPALIRLQKPGETDVLMMTFAAQPEHAMYQTKPYSFLKQLLESHKTGRLVSVLKDKGLIDDLQVGMGFQGSNYATFNIGLTLTEEGAASSDRVIASVFGYLRNMREAADLEALFSEQSRQAEEAFRYPRKAQVIQEVSSLAVSLMRYPANEVLTAPILMQTFDADMIHSALDSLTPDNVVVTYAGNFDDLPEIEPVTGIAYSNERPSEKRLTAWQSREDLLETKLVASANPFEAENKNLVPLEGSAQLPVNLSDKDGVTLWYLHDSEFREPRGAITLAVESPAVEDSIEGSATNRFYISLLHEGLSELAQLGTDAGIELGIQRTDQGVILSIYGFTAKHPEFARAVAEAIRDLKVKPRLLRKARARSQVEMDTVDNAQYFERILVALNNELRPGIHQPWDEMVNIRNLDEKVMGDFHQSFWHAPELTFLVHGNYTEQQANDVANAFITTLDLESAPNKNRLKPVKFKTAIEKRVEQVPAGVAATHYPWVANDPESIAVLMITTQMLHNQIFQRFRDSQQWGYVAFATLSQGYNHWGVTLLLQAPGMEPEKLDGEIDAVVQHYRNGLAELEPKLFDQFRSGIRQAIGARKQNLQSYTGYWWSTLRETGKPIDRAAEIERVLDKMDIEVFRQQSRKLIAQDAPVLALLSAKPESSDN